MAIVMCLFATACTDDGYVNGRQGGKSLEKELCPTGCRGDVRGILDAGDLEEVGDGMFVTGGEPGAVHLDVCSALPKDGACAIACDDKALAAIVAPGSCTQLVCPLNDGRRLLVARCLPAVQITN